MLILTNVNMQAGTISAFDTKDKSNDTVYLATLLPQIRANKLRIYGLSNIGKRQVNDPNAIAIPNLGISISWLEAKQALVNYYVSQGVDRKVAKEKVGI